ncbi:MAG TPA: energy transducer TonB [Pyrinomonadaceae bacterium]|nr:energy transducer TonB [Pyrinomonadaceae bacterium]
MSNPCHLLLSFIACALLPLSGAAQAGVRVAVLDFGGTATGVRASERLSRAFASAGGLSLTDREESRAAARGAGYAGSLNMTLDEARDLGGSLGSDFYVTGDAQTLRRSPSTGPHYFEAYASVFVVSSRTGRLVMWDRPSFEASAPEEAEKTLLEELGRRAARYSEAIRRARVSESSERAQTLARAGASLPVIEDAPDDEAAAERAGLRLPQPYRRLRPAYPDSAARAEAEATVDVKLEIDESGEVSRVEVVRWAGFGLDEATVATVSRLHFTPARLNGSPVPVRVLLRYNFRKPAKEVKR